MGDSSLKKALHLVWMRCKGWLIGSVLISIVLGLNPIAILWVSKELINAVADLIMKNADNQLLMMQLLAIQFLLFLLASVLKGLQILLNSQAEIQLDHELQKRVSSKATTVPLAYFDIPDFYNHMSRVTRGMGNRFLGPIKSLMEIGKESISIVSFLIYLFTVHWSLVVLSLLAAIPIFVMQSKFGQQRFGLMVKLSPLARETFYFGNLMQDRQTAKEVRLFGLGFHLMRRWSELFWQNAGHQIKLLRRQQTVTVGLDAVTALFYLASAGIIVWLTGRQTIRVGDFVAIGQAVQGTQQAVNVIAMQMARLYEQSLYIHDFFRFLEFEEPSLTQKQGTKPFPMPLVEGISVENVSFRYHGAQEDTLKRVSCTIRPGEKVAIVGENGSGKTTLVKCLMGLYGVQEGQICVEGLTLAEIDPQEMYRHITVIFQDFTRYQISARDNIAFGHIEEAGDQERLKAAARQSGAEAFVHRLPQGYDTYLGRYLHEGVDLSGGQWQKIALARALFRDAEIVILDEPTAALDPEAELDVFRQFDLLTRNKTAIFISHRMSAARMADRILVMKNGELIESGSHDELISLDGEYAKMYRMQAQWYA